VRIFGKHPTCSERKPQFTSLVRFKVFRTENIADFIAFFWKGDICFYSREGGAATNVANVAM
jgi:hypothetical protein